MSTPAVANIIKSNAVVWVAPTGEAEPDETSVAFGAAWGGNWARVGYTKDVLKMAYESEEADVNVEEVVGPVDRWRIQEQLLLETVLGELTAEYVNLAAGSQGTVSTTAAGGAQKAFEEVTIGGQAKITQKAWGFEGLFVTSGGDDEPVRVFVPYGTAMMNGELEFSKKSDEYVGTPIQIKALADTANSDRMFKFQRVTSETT